MLEPCAALGVSAGRHRFDFEEQIVQTRGAGQARIERGSKDRLALRQIRLGAFQRQMATNDFGLTPARRENSR
jgi:hypothetical protein